MFLTLRPQAALLLMLLPLGLTAQGITEDAQGCKDSTLLNRMRGCFIQTCDVKEFDQATIRTGAHRENNDQVKQLEGQTEILSCECSGKISPLQVVRNAEAAMKQAGYQSVFSGKNENEYHTVTGRKGSQWLMVAANVGGD